VKNLILIITNRFFAIAQNDIFELANGIMYWLDHNFNA